MTAPLFERLAVIGLGLIGSSLARRVRRDGIAGELVAHDASPAVRARVAELGIADRVAETAAEAAEDADCVVLCVPVGAMGPAASALLPHMRPGAILSDVGSTKQSVIETIRPLLPPGRRLRAGAPAGRHRAFGPGRRVPDPVRGALDAAHPAGGGAIPRRRRGSRRCGGPAAP